ncbi:glycosyl transferase [Indibacter alkaliphilus LW1]|uniref:Glycosyl transferase n=1 Tax=Indibacter alkaliphilus (strain CCUG 57479 / KCTC 22604 / LW1) TaxID=1189612 RepID=S2D3G7_INDAL|nr:glycosyltransferase family 1 protein [Indibacter alkaliphilus]EOZ93857.1 glycosyl transferase [Indibacter alkaliphilus LW1]
MKIAIDATNLKSGGGLSHLKQISKEIYNSKDIEIHLFGGDWIKQVQSENKHVFREEFSSIFKQEYFKRFELPKLLANFDIVFAPGGSFYSKKTPYITMCRNMLVFEEVERNRFPFSFTWLRYLFLERIQLRSYLNSKGIIYISEYAKKYVETKYPELKSKKSKVIYHGISNDFRQKPKKQKPLEFYSQEKPFKLLYVSIINYYKHQWNVIEAVTRLRVKGFPIVLELVGPIYKGLNKRMAKVLNGTDSFIYYKGALPYEEIESTYKNADAFIFASTCENMPNILVEAMSAGLPILCSNYGPMPEVLKDGGIYFDPIDVESITMNLEMLLIDPEKRQKIAQRSYEYSQGFSWKKTADETLKFIKELGGNQKINETNHTRP